MVSIVDFAIVTGQDSGDIVALELAELDEDVRTAFDDLDGEVSGLLSEEDLTFAGGTRQPGSTAAVIVWENTWARKLVAAIRARAAFSSPTSDWMQPVWRRQWIASAPRCLLLRERRTKPC